MLLAIEITQSIKSCPFDGAYELATVGNDTYWSKALAKTNRGAYQEQSPKEKLAAGRQAAGKMTNRQVKIHQIIFVGKHQYTVVICDLVVINYNVRSGNQTRNHLLPFKNGK